jgi:ATP-dependent Clp protease ATP-binding subunit ClpC
MYTFNSRQRYRAVRSYRVLTSPLMLAVAAIGLIITFTSWLAYFVFGPLIDMLALSMVAFSVAAAAVLAITFAATYYPFAKPSVAASELVDRSVRQGEQNVAAAASFELLITLGPAAQRTDERSLQKSLAELIHSSAINHLLRRLQLNRDEVRLAVENTVLPDLTWPEFGQRMLDLAVSLRQEQLTPEHALGALLLHEAMHGYLRTHSLTDDDVRFVLWWGAEERQQQQFRHRWWAEERLLAFPGIGLSWAAGYTPFVDQFARIPSGNFWDDVIFGHEEKLGSLINSLARQRQSNVLLVGDPGVGVLGIIRQLARLIKTQQAHPALDNDRLVYINVGELVAAGADQAAQLSSVSRALREMERSGNIIVVLGGLGSILGVAGDQRVNLTDILTPFLSSRAARVIVMASAEDYHRRIKSNDELMQYFEVVLVPPLSEAATLKRIALALPAIERAAGVNIPYQSIRALVRDTSSIMPHIPFPERAFDFLEETIVLVQREGRKVLTVSHIQRIISRKIGINLGRLKMQEKHHLLNLERLMHERLVNQDAAVKTVARAMIRARAQVRSTERPIGTFLFLGPTGVGKTETAKTLAEVYFGAQQHMVRLDMSEFQGAQAVGRLIGSPGQPVGRLTSLIADHPFTVLLLDEFEKADEQVHQLFLQVFDEGHLTDINGRNFSFQNAIIIATSNAGAELIRRETQDGQVPKEFENKLKEHILSNDIMRPELLNRFDAVITFTALSPEHIRQIARLMLRSLNRRLDEQHGVTVAITDELVDFLFEAGYQPEFGARPMARAVQDTVEFAVAQLVLQGEVKPGAELVLQPQHLRALKLSV